MATACINGEELWRECASWLTRLDILRSDHRANWHNATIVDLANTLRDGVLLCQLLTRLDQGCIDLKDVNLKPTMAQFLCLKNIQLFLHKCNSVFGLKDSDLFDPLMLFDLTNFHKVLCTLSKLSLSAKALKSNVPGFSAQMVKSREEEDIYQSLKSVEPPARSRKSWDYDLYAEYNIREEEIYQDLCLAQIELVSTQPLEKRDFVIKELVDTEKNYVDVLGKLKKNFMIPLQRILKPEVHAVVFCKISELHEIHTGFLSQLLKLNTDRSVRLSTIFMAWRDNFLVYGTYCANLTQACALLQDVCDKDEELNQAIINFEKEDNNGKFKLRDVLSVPMQRILKYHLLLEKLIEFTDPNHEDYNDLKRAREAMLDVAGYINETARDTEHINVIKKLHENIVEWSAPSDFKLEKCGRLLRDGELRVKAHNDNKVRSRYVFIFDKCMVVCKQMKGTQFAYRDMLFLQDYRVDDYNNRALLNQNARWCYQFHLVKHDQSIVYTFSARSIEIKSKMIKALRDAMDNLRPAALAHTNHKFEMHTFDTTTSCNRCSKYLRGRIYQGYKCKTCDIAVHKECITGCGKCGFVPRTSQTLSDKLWFVGEMDRNEASTLLEKRLNGTYLVRLRSHCNDEDRYALSLKTDNTVKHMKICSSIMGSDEKYYLSFSKYFNSIEELIENYQQYSLKENFERLEEHTKLEWPFRQIKVVATRNFEPQDNNQLRLVENKELVVFGKEGYRDGWWKGKSEYGVGYFPSSHVKVIGQIQYDLYT